MFLQHSQATQKLPHLLNAVQYMDRIYVKHQQKVPVHQLGLDKWWDVVIRNKQISERLLGTLLELVHKERTGDVIDRALMRSITMVSIPVSDAVQSLLCNGEALLTCCSRTCYGHMCMLYAMQMLMDLGPVVYVEDFEKHFLAESAEFYQVSALCKSGARSHSGPNALQCTC